MQQHQPADGDSPLGRILARIEGPRQRAGKSWLVRCPAHRDGSPSLSVTTGDDGRALLNCQAGCETTAVLAAIGLTLKDLFVPKPDNQQTADRPKTLKTPLTLAEFAQHKKLPIERLHAMGLKDARWFADPCVDIPYYRLDGTVHRVRVRAALAAKEGSKWREGEGQIPYTPDRCELARAERYAIVCEGESDTLTLLFAGFPAIGIPGASNTHVLGAEHLRDLDRVFLVHEPDTGGDTFIADGQARLKELAFAGKVRLLPMPDAAKDPSALWQRDQQAFAGKLNGAMRAAEEGLSPTAENPLKGLVHLGPIALVGREKILSLAAEPVDYVWQDIAVSGTIVVMAGPPGEGKTTLLFLLAAARLNTGGPVKLLSRHVAPAPAGQWVVLIEGEHGEKSAARKLVKSVRLMGVADSALDRVIILARKSVLIGSNEWADVVKLVAAGLVSDIAIDTLARCAPGDANAEHEQVAIFNMVANGIEQAPEGVPKPTVWIVAHTRKKNGGPVHIEDVSGSAQRVGQADSVLMVNGSRIDGRMVSSRVSFEKLREEPADYPLPVEFTLQGDRLDESENSTQDDRPLPVRIVELLRANGPQTANALGTALQRSNADVQTAITQLFAAGAIRSGSALVKGVERKTFLLAPERTRDGTPDDGV